LPDLADATCINLNIDFVFDCYVLNISSYCNLLLRSEDYWQGMPLFDRLVSRIAALN